MSFFLHRLALMRNDGAVPATSLTQEGSATSSASTITAPATIQAGDVIFMADKAAGSTSVPATVVPTGFTAIVNTSSGITERMICSYKIADGSEASASITGMNGNSSNRKAIYVIRANKAAIAVKPKSVNGQITDGNPTLQTVTASTGIPALVIFGVYGTDSAAISPRTFSTIADGEINPATNFYMAYKIYNSSPANTSIDMDDEGLGNALQSFYAEIDVAP